MGFLNKMKTSQTGDIYCDWCGAYIKNDMNGGFVEQMGFGIVKRGISLAKKHYCSSRAEVRLKPLKKQKRKIMKCARQMVSLQQWSR